MITKVCGLRDSEDIRRAMEMGADWIGFDFNPASARYVSMIPTHAGIIPDKAELDAINVKQAPKRVGVFLDEMPQSIITRAVNYKLDILQLNGNEGATLIRNLRSTLDPDICPGIRIMKRVCIPASPSANFDISVATLPYMDCVDYFLFEIESPSTGVSDKVHWQQLLKDYTGHVPFLLGGTPTATTNLREYRHPQFIGTDTLI